MTAMDETRSFDFIDTNMDGWVSKAELGDLFVTFDDNGDGKVNTVEFINRFTMIGMSAEDSLYVFYIIDYNSDLLLDATEVSNFFENMDANGDEHLSRGDYVYHMHIFLSRW
ncbi:uncharacterized protein [Watersipora subatra]